MQSMKEQLILLIDGLKPEDKVVIVASSTSPEEIDPVMVCPASLYRSPISTFVYPSV